MYLTVSNWERACTSRPTARRGHCDPRLRRCPHACTPPPWLWRCRLQPWRSQTGDLFGIERKPQTKGFARSSGTPASTSRRCIPCSTFTVEMARLLGLLHHGVDSKGAIRAAEEKTWKVHDQLPSGADVNFHEGGVRDLPEIFPDQAFELIISTEPDENLVHPEVAVSQMRALLAPSGTILLVTRSRIIYQASSTRERRRR